MFSRGPGWECEGMLLSRDNVCFSVAKELSGRPSEQTEAGRKINTERKTFQVFFFYFPQSQTGFSKLLTKEQFNMKLGGDGVFSSLPRFQDNPTIQSMNIL